MAVPRNRSSEARKRSRRSHHALSTKSLSVCKNCKEISMLHTVCQKCGSYKGKKVLDIKE